MDDTRDTLARDRVRLTVTIERADGVTSTLVAQAAEEVELDTFYHPSRHDVDRRHTEWGNEGPPRRIAIVWRPVAVDGEIYRIVVTPTPDAPGVDEDGLSPLEVAIAQRIWERWRTDSGELEIHDDPRNVALWLRPVLPGFAPPAAPPVMDEVDVAHGAERILDLLEQLGIDPDERPEHGGRSIAETLAAAVLRRG